MKARALGAEGGACGEKVDCGRGYRRSPGTGGGLSWELVVGRGAHLQVPVDNVFLVTVVHSRYNLGERREGQLPEAPKPPSFPQGPCEPTHTEALDPGLPEAQADAALAYPIAPTQSQRERCGTCRHTPPLGHPALTRRYQDTLPAATSEQHMGTSPA